MNRYGLLGETLTHSFSKIIHEKLCRYTYDLLPMDKEELAAFLYNRDFDGVNVTIPYKQEVMPFCDVIDESAKQIGAVNTIVNRGGALFGYNTDFYGFEYLLKKNNIDVANKNVYILGSGATAKTVTAVLRHLNAKSITVVSRTTDLACEVACDRVITYEQAGLFMIDTAIALPKKSPPRKAGKIPVMEILIGTTPRGMYPNNYDTTIDTSGCTKLQAVVDVIYNPLKTGLIMQVKRSNPNVICANGLMMLVAQAVYAAEYFLDEHFGSNLDTMIEKIHSEICREMCNLVIVGMPGAGKTSIGRAVAELLNRQFVDIDYVIEQNAQKTIPQIFCELGESHFRQLEADTIKQISMQNGIVISTGGGALMSEDNVQALRQNGCIVFLDRPIDKLSMNGRPLSTSAKALTEMYKNRRPVYVGASDAIVCNDGKFNDAVSAVKESFYETAVDSKQ